jgi:hypothetical protein
MIVCRWSRFLLMPFHSTVSFSATDRSLRGSHHMHLYMSAYLLPVNIDVSRTCHASLLRQREARAHTTRSTDCESLHDLNPAVQVVFSATDGDAGSSTQDRSQFCRWFPVYKGEGLDFCLRIIEGMLPFYIADFLHVVKNVRCGYSVMSAR